MFALAWKKTEPNGNQPIRVSFFSTEERRQDFIDTMTASDTRFEITSMNKKDDHVLSDFHPGMRVRIERALHGEYIGKTGIVEKTVKKNSMVYVRLDNWQRYGVFAWNLSIS